MPYQTRVGGLLSVRLFAAYSLRSAQRPLEGSMNGLLVSAAGSSPGLYFGWGSFSIQFGNLVVIVLMIVLFVLALLLPFPRGRRRR